MAVRTITLRQGGVCSVCHKELEPGAAASWDTDELTVRCPECVAGGDPGEV